MLIVPRMEAVGEAEAQMALETKGWPLPWLYISTLPFTWMGWEQSGLGRAREPKRTGTSLPYKLIPLRTPGRFQGLGSQGVPSEAALEVMRQVSRFPP